MKKFLFFILISVNSLFISTEVVAQTRTEKSRAVQAVKNFYRFHLSHEDAFNQKGVSLRRRFFTPKLQKLFDAELKRERLYRKKISD